MTGSGLRGAGLAIPTGDFAGEEGVAGEEERAGFTEADFEGAIGFAEADLAGADLAEAGLVGAAALGAAVLMPEVLAPEVLVLAFAALALPDPGTTGF